MSETTAPGAGDPTPPVIEAEPARPVGGAESERSSTLGRPSRQERARSAGYRSRFVLIYLGLALVAGIGVGAFVVILTRPDPAPTPKWSAWAPTGSETAQVRQIADQIAKHYRMKGGQQLVAALPSAPKVTGSGGDVAVSAIAIRPDTSTGKKEEDEIDVVPATHSYQYILCGLGTNCSIKGGAASTARHALLRREALELALYTFKYVHDIDSVSVFLPPRPDGASSATSVFLKRSDVETELHKPLADSIGSKTPSIGGMNKKELALVNRITEPRLYSYEYQQAQDGSAVLIYDPVVLGA
jgi:hypothetical protein